MIEERAKQAKNRKLQAQIDQTRELNAKRKMEKIGNREWDIAKQNEDWKQGRAWDVGKKDGDQQEKEGNPEQSEAAGKGFPLSRIEEKKREAAISSDKPKPKPRMYFTKSTHTFLTSSRFKGKRREKNGLAIWIQEAWEVPIQVIMIIGVQPMPTLMMSMKMRGATLMRMLPMRVGAQQSTIGIFQTKR